MRILTFDVEEWFHILDNESTKTTKEWSNYEIRIHSNMNRIFDLLAKSNQKATFFVVGWIAEKYPEVVKKISEYGYEIGSHTYMHQLMYEQNKKEVKYDLKKSINILESITGKKVRAFRAPGFSIIEKNKWVFEILAENGITHDSSIFPAGRAHGGFPSYSTAEPSIVDLNGYQLKEFPINTASILNKKWIYSGGGYFRLTPYNMIKYWTESSDYIMTYFHPRDFDPNQPMIKELSLSRKFKSYVGLKICMKKLEKWINDFDFIDLSEADKLIDWNKATIVKL
jgi:polysaccharide deacetylase family protein (PEP-CTERM system associated)